MSQSSAVRIVNVDFYMSPPLQEFDVMYSDFRASSVSQVPIIRIFGSTDSNQKICLHVHGVFPYLYIPYDGNEDPNVLKYQIAINIDKAINISFGQASSTTQHVFKIILISGIPFYGYHSKEHQFFKIFLYNPALIRKVSNMLQSEVILGRLYQPHESHIPYILQFMIDYNLHGMSRIFVRHLTFRDETRNETTPKQSFCELEADTKCDDILNHLEISQDSLGVNPGIAALWEDEKQRLRNEGEDSDIGSCLTLEQSQTEPTKTHLIYQQILKEKLLVETSNDSSCEQNLSVYPAETPHDETINSSFSESNLNITFDEDANDLFEILQDLGRKNLEEIEESDSILSQVQKDDEDDYGDFFDLSMSIAETSPFKNILEDLDTTLVPQLDGHNDPGEKSTQKKKKKYGALPIFVNSPNNNSNQDLEQVKRKLSFNEITICEEILDCKYKFSEKEVIFNSGKKRKKSITETKMEQEIQIEKPEISLTAAELYDIERNYKAKEGCSSKLTQESDIKNTPESDMFCDNSPNFNPNQIIPISRAPTRREVLQSLEKHNLSIVVNQKPFYSDPTDVTGSVEIGHNILKISSKTTQHLDDCKNHFNGIDAYRKTKIPLNIKYNFDNLKKLKLSYCSGETVRIVPVDRPPTRLQVLKSLNKYHQAEIKERKFEKILIPNSPGDGSDLELTLTLTPDEIETNQKVDNSCQITGQTLDNTYGFKSTPENFQNVKALNENESLTILAVEIHVETRGDLRPDPEYDQVVGIFYAILNHEGRSIGLIGVASKIEFNCNFVSVSNELELFEELIKLVRKWDPDILIGYETELLSWGFLLDRSKILGEELMFSLSRIKDRKVRLMSDDGLKVTGRILLDFWRLLKYEIALQSYTFENITYHILQKRVPLYSFKNLTSWWRSPLWRHRTISYYLLKVETILQILDQLDLLGRTCELARLFGIQFYEVLSRGSQFRVESMMLRLAKPLNFIPVSPSVAQRAKMRAPEFLPLILEPESKLYVDPVIVLDFQSLYPSVIIAYNYCFSTCLGKVSNLGKNAAFDFGATHLKISPIRVRKLFEGDNLNFSPCGVAFVKKRIRDGILPRMLREILETRLMVKQSMKRNTERVLQKVLHNRQLGLKLIANVTYGYSAANYSGRMPCVELADSVVAKGRETLQRAIELVEKTTEWGARVVYGDTDSMFVLIPGRTRAEAFEIGKKIADSVTAANPDPIKLKLEKIYQPCVLQTKKRYVGYMFESADQKEPIYNAKGIETVRRDGCPAVAKMLEKCLRLVFETRDVSLVKKYVLRQFTKILTGRVSLQDLTFAKEYRGSTGYRPGACVPALELTRKWTAVDRRNEPRRGQRVPYVIVSGPPGVPLIRLVRSPYDILNDPTLRPNAIYYITKVIIPPINRCFNLFGADLNVWFNQMPRRNFQYLTKTSPIKKSTISQYFQTNSCAVCLEQTQKSFCEKCAKQPHNSLVVLNEKLRLWETSFCDISLICQSCTSIGEDNICMSLDCPILYKLNQTRRDLDQVHYVREVIQDYFLKM